MKKFYEILDAFLYIWSIILIILAIGVLTCNPTEYQKNVILILVFVSVFVAFIYNITDRR